MEKLAIGLGAVFLGMLPIGNTQNQTLFLALVTSLGSGVLIHLLFAVLDLITSRLIRQRTMAALCGLLLEALVWGWQLAHKDLLILGTAIVGLLGLIALGIAVKKMSGDLLAWAVVFAICCMLVTLIANLYALEQLHGMQAVNHALFVCAVRLRRMVPSKIEIAGWAAMG